MPELSYFCIDASQIIVIPNSKVGVYIGWRHKGHQKPGPSGSASNALGIERDVSEIPLSAIATALIGITTGDLYRFIRQFWEPLSFGISWEPLQSSDGSGPVDLEAEPISCFGKMKVEIWRS